MKPETVVKKLSEIIKNDVDALSSNIMIKIGNQYQLFETYTVEKKSSHNYTATKKRQDSRNFFRMQSAVAWCIADKLGQYNISQRIIDLDQQCAAVKTDVESRRLSLNNMSKIDQQLIVSAKLASKQDALKLLENQLTKCVNLTKYWQIKGFIRDETARPRNSKNTR